MRLFIAEKPALAKIIAEALGNPIRKDGFIECGSDTVTWCVGHILELSPPESHNPDYAKWKAEHLPLKLRPAKYQPKKDTEKQFNVIEKLLTQSSIIVHAGDPDDEGQLLVDEVLTYCNNRKPVKRVLINDLNTAAAKKALANLRENSEFFGLSQKALSRSIGDQLYGFNMTRAYTLAAQKKGIQGVLSIGRVQTPILGLIVNRYNANKNHTAAFYYNLAANITINGNNLAPRYQVPESAPVDDKGRLIDESFAKVVAEACKEQTTTVTASQIEEKEILAPLPFSLLDLQAQMSKKQGLSAQKTLEITQSLRENHKAITYNRSDCNYLTSEQFGDAEATLDAIFNSFPEMVNYGVDRTKKNRAFDDSKVSAHTAIIPTTTAPDISKMTADEKIVYKAIVEQYLSQFLPEKKYLAASVTFLVNGHDFIAKATKTTQDGWTTLLSGNESDETESTDKETLSSFDALEKLSKNDDGHCKDVTISKEKTKPLPLYTEATLLKDLQRVAKYVKDPKVRQLLKDRDAGKTGEHGGIGTPATRATMLETLQKRGFYTVEGKKLIPTELGLDFIASLPEIATSPDMTALWHEQQKMIEEGKLTVDAFLDTLEDFISEQVKGVTLTMPDGVKKTTGQNARLETKCPKCQSEIVVSPKVFACSGCDMKVWAEIASKKLTESQVETLLSKGKTGLIKGFKSKAGKSFDAKLSFDSSTGKVSFEFENKK